MKESILDKFEEFEDVEGDSFEEFDEFWEVFLGDIDWSDEDEVEFTGLGEFRVIH